MGQPRSIFISHDSDDKARIAPYVRALLDEGFVLFIDTPDAMGIDTNHPRVQRIRMAEDWRDVLPGAVRDADHVLFFLTDVSARKLGARDILTEEVYHGAVLNKLRVCALVERRDALDGLLRAMPGTAKTTQAKTLILGTDPAGDPEFRSMAAELREDVAAAPGGPRDGLRAEVAAKLVNRAEQAFELREAAKGSLRRAVAGDGPGCEAVVMLARRGDYPELLKERFCDFDGTLSFDDVRREIERSGAAAPWLYEGAWTPAKMQVRPGAVKAAQFDASLEGALEDVIAQRGLRDPGGAQATVPFVTLSEADIRSDPGGIAERWIARWDAAMADPMTAPVLPVLIVSFEPGGSGFLGRLFGGDPAEASCKAIAEAVQSAQPRSMGLRLIDGFSEVERKHAEDWLHEHIRGTNYYAQVHERLSKLFGRDDDAARYPMRDFYNDLIRQPPFS